MRSTSHTRVSRSNSSIPWTWILIVIFIIGIITVSSLGSSDSSGESDKVGLRVLPMSGEVSIKPASGSAKQITEEEQLYTSDISLSVQSGIARISSSFIDGYIDKLSELAYTEHGTDGEKIELARGKIWIESHGNNILQMKNLTASIPNDGISLAEQNPIFSTIYALKGSINIEAEGKRFILNEGKKIMISKSDLSNPSTTLEGLTEDIDTMIKQYPLYIFRNGDTIIKTLSSFSGSQGSGNIINSESLSGNILGGTSVNYIDITTPLDESNITTPTIEIAGQILSKDVQRVTINDIDAIVSPVEGTFTLKGIPTTSDIMNMVYKAYSKDATILERGVLTLYPKNRQAGTDKLTPNNFPINDKNYRITSPSENPYKTTDSSVTVRGTVPKDTVKYIMVNNYRLNKFIPNSTTWYYYANIDYDTMKEGINAYEITFYDANDKALFKQLFTIVKEQKGTVSGEIIQ